MYMYTLTYMYYCQIQPSPNGPEWNSKEIKKRQTHGHTEKLSSGLLDEEAAPPTPTEAQCVLYRVKQRNRIIAYS